MTNIPFRATRGPHVLSLEKNSACMHGPNVIEVCHDNEYPLVLRDVGIISVILFSSVPEPTLLDPIA